MIAIAFALAACTSRDVKRPMPQESAPVAAVEAGTASSPGAAASDAASPYERVLLVGDSHTYGAFGATLHELLSDGGRRAVVSEGAGGATTETYLSDAPVASVGYRVRASTHGEAAPRELVDVRAGRMHSLAELLATHDPDIVVVALGTNAPRGSLAETCEELLRRLSADRTGGPRRRRVFWIGPPAFGSSVQAIVQTLEAVVERHPDARFIDSTPFNERAPLPASNPHFGPDDARAWARYVFARMQPVVGGP
jgi:hypothetical protein